MPAGTTRQAYERIWADTVRAAGHEPVGPVDITEFPNARWMPDVDYGSVMLRGEVT